MLYLKCIKDILSKRNFAYNTLEFEYLEKRVLYLFYTHCKIYWFYYFIWWCTSAVQSMGLSVVSGPGMNLASYILLQWKRLKSLKQFTKKQCWWGCGEWETLIHCSQECKPIWPLWKAVQRLLKNKTKNRNRQAQLKSYCMAQLCDYLA